MGVAHKKQRPHLGGAGAGAERSCKDAAHIVLEVNVVTQMNRQGVGIHGVQTLQDTTPTVGHGTIFVHLTITEE